MTSFDAYPAYGQVWTHRKSGREAFIKDIINLPFAEYVLFQYFDSLRCCEWEISKFRKQHTFTYVDAA